MLYDRLLRPLLFRLDAEKAHHVALSALASAPGRTLAKLAATTVQQPLRVWGLEFRNALGLAAGFDKNGIALRAWHGLGFGFVEIGTVTQHAQSGNAKPRVFRVAERRALINRLGFPNDGAEAVAARLAAFRERGPGFPIGVNIGKSKITPIEEAAEDYLASFRVFHSLADFFVVNVSSPNTPGLRDLQRPEQLHPILRMLKEHDARQPARRPLLVKIAPDLDDAQLVALLETIDEFGIDGIVATNTTIEHGDVPVREQGGLSGVPLRERSTEIVRRIARETGGKLPIIAVGGVFSREDFREKIDAGASLVEIYTGFVYRGPRCVQRILR